jgi:hypothetical protein
LDCDRCYGFGGERDEDVPLFLQEIEEVVRAERRAEAF